MRAHITTKVAAALFCTALGLGAPGFAARQTAAAKPATTTATASTAKKVTVKPRVVRKRAPKARVQAAPTAARISEIQSALATKGTYKAQPNGKWDNATIQAMKDFQSSHGLTVTGKLDALTLQKLGLGSEIAGRAAPLPPQTPTANSSSGQQQTP